MILHKCDRCGEIFEVPQLEVLVHRLRFKPCFHHPSYELCHKCSCEFLKFLDGGEAGGGNDDDSTRELHSA